MDCFYYIQNYFKMYLSISKCLLNMSVFQTDAHNSSSSSNLCIYFNLLTQELQEPVAVSTRK
jgi:hypothetical protein